MHKLAVIIPAAGSGSRMQKETPKPFLQLGEASILEYTMRRFAGLDRLSEVVIAAPDALRERALELVRPLLAQNVKLYGVKGGRERQDSIYNALQRVGKVDLVAVHDAVRPFVRPSHIVQCCDVAEQWGGAVLGVHAKDTIKRTDEREVIVETPDRSSLWQAQTPQIFRRDILLDAYEKARREGFIGTDDASLVERAGHSVKMVLGSRDNFKITYPFDLKVARMKINETETSA